MNDWKNFVNIKSEKNSNENLPIQIGNSIVVDGFIKNKKNAVFTHFHTDHISQIDVVAGEYFHKILLHPITYDVMIALDRTRKFKRVISPLPYGKTHTTKFGEEITLYDADHIPGSCQVHVKVDNKEILYSGDFVFPSATTPKCDILVLDANHGIPQFNVNSERDSVLNRLFAIIKEKISEERPIVISTERGTLQELMNFLDVGPEGDHFDYDVPFIAKEKEIIIKDVIYQESQSSREFLKYDTPEAFRILKNKSTAIIFTTKLHLDSELENMYTVYANRYASFHTETPIFEQTDNLLRVNLLSHGTYDGIIEYVRKNEPDFVITDSSRQKTYAPLLARAITEEFGYPAISLP